jgi:hypothetical protein
MIGLTSACAYEMYIYTTGSLSQVNNCDYACAYSRQYNAQCIPIIYSTEDTDFHYGICVHYLTYTYVAVAGHRDVYVYKCCYWCY